MHHLIAYIDTTGQGRQLDARRPGARLLGPVRAGDRRRRIELLDRRQRAPPPARWRSASAFPPSPTSSSRSTTIPRGKAGIDKTRVGLYFSRKPIKQALHWNNASSYDFRLPAGDNNVEVKASWFVPVDVEALAVSPHMHLLGHDMHMSVRLPNGRTQNLIEIADWDPSWQSAYYFQKPISLWSPGQSSMSSRTSTTPPTHATPTSLPSWSSSGPTSTTRCASATSPS